MSRTRDWIHYLSKQWPFLLTVSAVSYIIIILTWAMGVLRSRFEPILRISYGRHPAGHRSRQVTHDEPWLSLDDTNNKSTYEQKLFPRLRERILPACLAFYACIVSTDINPGYKVYIGIKGVSFNKEHIILTWEIVFL